MEHNESNPNERQTYRSNAAALGERLHETILIRKTLLLLMVLYLSPERQIELSFRNIPLQILFCHSHSGSEIIVPQSDQSAAVACLGVKAVGATDKLGLPT